MSLHVEEFDIQGVPSCGVCGGDGVKAHIHPCRKASLPTEHGGCGGPWYCSECQLDVLCGDIECRREHDEKAVAVEEELARLRAALEGGR